MARRVRIVVGFFAGFFFMHTKLNKNLYKVNPRRGCPPAVQAVSHLCAEVWYM
jgi:hypothetical protein